MLINRLVLDFASGEKPSLFQTRLSFEGLPGDLMSVRGKTGGAFRGVGTFQWTRAVQAITLLLMLHKLYGAETIPGRALLFGEGDSLASSLDFAISKRPVWLCEMFGTTSGGEAFAGRLFRRSNPNRKRPGPVVLSVNEKILSNAAVEVRLDGKPCDQAAVQRIAEQLSSEPQRELSMVA